MHSERFSFSRFMIIRWPLFVALAWVLFWSPCTLAKSKIAVLILKAGTQVDEGLADDLTEVLIAQIAQMGTFDIIGKDTLKDKLGVKSDLKAGDCVYNPLCVSSVGAGLGLDFVIIGNLGLVDNVYSLIFVRIFMSDEPAQKLSYKVQGDISKLVDVTKEAVPKLTAPPKKKKPGFISVNANKEDAMVYINDKFIGRVPLSNLEYPEGKYKVRLVEKDSRPFEQEVYVKPEQTSTVQAELQPIVVVETMPVEKKKPFWTGYKIGGFIALGITVLSSGTFIATGSQVRRIHKDLTKLCPTPSEGKPATCNATEKEIKDKVNKANMFAKLTNVFIGIASASAAIMVTLFILDAALKPKEEQKKPSHNQFFEFGPTITGKDGFGFSVMLHY